MSVPPAQPRKRHEAQLRAECHAIAAKLGLSADDADKIIHRAGGLREARTRLSERLRRIQQQVLDRHERELTEEEAAKRREIHERERLVFAASRSAARAQRTLGTRLDETVAAISVLSTARAARLQLAPAHGAPDDPERQAPPPAAQIDISPHLSVIAHHVEAIEHELDVARGHAEPKPWRRLSTEQLYDYIVEHFAGVHSEIVARDCPELGSARTIRRARFVRGLRGVDGLPKQESAA